MTAMVKTMIYCILLHLRSNVGVNSKGQSLGNLYQGLCLSPRYVLMIWETAHFSQKSRLKVKTYIYRSTE